MHVRLPRVKWVRDPEIGELIEHLDKPRTKDWPTLTPPQRLELLSPGEVRVVLTEMDRCRRDFSYASRNYFWIQDKRTRKDILFKLWESQELLLEIIMNLKAKGLSQRIQIIKARQLGCSTLIEGLIAWRTFYFSNINSLIVSYNPDHAAYLFAIPQFIYDHFPWWMKPMCSSREFKTGMVLDNPDYDKRMENPGLNSKIVANGANALTGVGQGVRLSAAHCSEYADWDDRKARDIIEEDILNALDDGPETFAILESTAKGAGRYAHKLWVDSEKLGENALFQPVFLPWFFDRTHRRMVDIGWKPKKEEAETREKVSRDWVRCDNPVCRQFQRRSLHGKNFTDTSCPTCEGAGTLRVFCISDEQLAWMQWRRENAQNDEESLQKLRQEQCVTSEESFVVSGVKLFSDLALRFAQMTCENEPKAKGHLDRGLKFHGHSMDTDRCFLEGCLQNHQYEQDVHLWIYDFPQPNATYVIGVDVGEGIGQDYSCATVLQISKHGGPDVEVAKYANNEIDAVSFGEFLNKLGRFYNDALIAVENNKLDSTETTLRIHLTYPNCYQAKNMTSQLMVTKRWGWQTNENTKPRLYQNLRKRLESRLIVIRDKFTVEELKWFRKDDDSAKMGAAEGFHDDRVISLQIASYVAHELDWDEESGITRTRVPLTMDAAPWIFTCKTCGYQWPSADPGEYRRCARDGCRSMVIEAMSRIQAYTMKATTVMDDERSDDLDEDAERLIPDYEML